MFLKNPRLQGGRIVVFTENLKFKIRSMKSEDALLLLFDKLQEFEERLLLNKLFPNQNVLIEGYLEIGKCYRIIKYVKGDDFTYVGASENKIDIEFVAKRATPFWENRSELVQIDCVGGDKYHDNSNYE